MNEKVEKALHTLGLYIADDELKSNARGALAAIREALEDYEKVRPLIEAAMRPTNKEDWAFEVNKEARTYREGKEKP